MLLEVEDIHVHYGKIEALKGISLEVDEGEIVTLIGANGGGQDHDAEDDLGSAAAVARGAILFDGKDISRMRRPQAGASSASGRRRRAGASSPA